MGIQGSLIFARIHDIHSSYNRSRSELEDSMARLATGDRFVKTGRELGGNLSLSEKYRYRIRVGEQSTQSVQHAMTFIDQADFQASIVRDVMHRMTELASMGTDTILSTNDRAALDAEYQSLIDEVSTISRNHTFYEKQSSGQDVLATFDTDDSEMHFYNLNGGSQHIVSKTFDNLAKDVNGNHIGFSESRDYTMSRDGRFLYFLGATDTGGADIRVKRYDISSDSIITGEDSFNATDKLFVDEQGNLFANSGGTLYSLDSSGMSRTATAVVDMASDQEFSVYKDQVTYHSTGNQILQYDLNTSTSSTLVTSPSTVVSPPPASAANQFAAGGVDHDISASGRYIADEIEDNVIRIIDTKNNTGTTLTLSGTATAITNLQFNEDGNRLYYVDTDANEVRYLNIGTDDNDQTLATLGSTVVEGKRDMTLSSLDLGGANYGAKIQYVLAGDEHSFLEYEGADLRLYNLGLLETSVDTQTNASSALTDLQTAQSRLSYQRAKLGATGLKLQHQLDAHEKYVADMREADTIIRDVDVAQEATNLSKLQFQNAAAGAMISQFNEVIQSVLLLINR